MARQAQHLNDGDVDRAGLLLRQAPNVVGSSRQRGYGDERMASQSKARRFFADPRGMTLLEIIVALAIAAAMLLLVVRMISGMTGSGTRSEVMHIAGAIRYSYGRAAINGWRYDVVVDISGNSYRIECSEKRSTIERTINEQTSGKERAFGGRDEDDEPFATNSAETALTSCSDAIVPDHTFERNVKVVRVQTSRTPEPIEEGETKIAIFPNGVIERAVIWLEGPRGRAYTLYTDEMTGRVLVRSGEEEPPDNYFELEED